MMSALPDDAAGSCLCGAVTFSIKFPTNWVAHCHCSICRRAHGAAFVTWVSAPEGQFAFSDPEVTLRWNKSSDHGERAFCSRCGSQLFFRGTKWPGEVHIPLANFKSGVDRAPQVHAFYKTHVDWFQVTDQLPKQG